MKVNYKVDYEKKGKIVYITLDGRGDLNLIPYPMYGDILDALVRYRDDGDANVAIMTGAGDKAFSAGADLKYYAEHPEVGGRAAELDRFWRPGMAGPAAIFNLELWKPVIAAVNGYCLGGGMMVMCGATDIRIAAENAQFGFPEISYGLGGASAACRIAHQIPYALAMDLALTGDTIDAQEAYRTGLVNKVVPLKELMPTAEEKAQKICGNPSLAVRAEKEAIVQSMDLPRRVGLRLSRALGEMSRPAVYQDVRAFLENRKRTKRNPNVD